MLCIDSRRGRVGQEFVSKYDIDIISWIVKKVNVVQCIISCVVYY